MFRNIRSYVASMISSFILSHCEKPGAFPLSPRNSPTNSPLGAAQQFWLLWLIRIKPRKRQATWLGSNLFNLHPQIRSTRASRSTLTPTVPRSVLPQFIVEQPALGCTGVWIGETSHSWTCWSRVEFQLESSRLGTRAPHSVSPALNPFRGVWWRSERVEVSVPTFLNLTRVASPRLPCWYHHHLRERVSCDWEEKLEFSANYLELFSIGIGSAAELVGEVRWAARDQVTRCSNAARCLFPICHELIYCSAKVSIVLLSRRNVLLWALAFILSGIWTSSLLAWN